MHSITQIGNVVNCVFSEVHSFFNDVALQLLVEKHEHFVRCIPNYLLPLRVFIINVDKFFVDTLNFIVVVVVSYLRAIQLLAD